MLLNMETSSKINKFQYLYRLLKYFGLGLAVTKIYHIIQAMPYAVPQADRLQWMVVYTYQFDLKDELFLYIPLNLSDWWFQTFGLFSIIYGLSSFPLTFGFFQDG
jgi:hypothetical protein